MSKNEQQTTNPKDAFSAYQQSFDKLFNTVKQSVPQYHQSVTNMQQECLQACENFVTSAVGMQKELARKSGIGTIIPESAAKIIKDSSDELVRASNIQNQIVLAAIDAAQQNIKTFNDNAKSFAELNKNIMQSWISAFTARTN